MKKFHLKGVLDRFQSSVAQPVSVKTSEQVSIEETLKSEHFQVSKVRYNNLVYKWNKIKIIVKVNLADQY